MNKNRENKVWYESVLLIATSIDDLKCWQQTEEDGLWGISFCLFVCLWVWTDRIKNNMWCDSHSVAQLQNTVDIPLISIETIIKQKHSRTNTATK